MRPQQEPRGGSCPAGGLPWPTGAAGWAVGREAGPCWEQQREVFLACWAGLLRPWERGGPGLGTESALEDRSLSLDDLGSALGTWPEVGVLCTLQGPWVSLATATWRRE